MRERVGPGVRRAAVERADLGSSGLDKNSGLFLKLARAGVPIAIENGEVNDCCLARSKIFRNWDNPPSGSAPQPEEGVLQTANSVSAPG